jgi:hypothetical protein
MSFFLYYFVPTIVSSVLLIKMVLLFHKIIGDLMGREQLEILRLAAGLWYTERRDIITARTVHLNAQDWGTNLSLIVTITVIMVTALV